MSTSLRHDPEVLIPTHSAVPTPRQASEKEALTRTPRMVRDALFTYVKPTPNPVFETLAWSDACFQTLGLDPREKSVSI